MFGSILCVIWLILSVGCIYSSSRNQRNMICQRHFQACIQTASTKWSETTLFYPSKKVKYANDDDNDGDDVVDDDVDN